MLPRVIAWFERCKKALELGEYEIGFRLVEGLEALGLCVADATYQIADIALRDPSDGSHPDWERSLLHEMVHVRMGGSLGTMPGTEERSALERGVEMMTRILYPMIKGGASQRAISNAARLCARTITTAREGLARGDMDPGKLIEAGAKIGEIRGREDVPEDVKGMLDEIAAIISEAAGGMSTEEPVVPEKDPAVDPMAAMSPEQEKMYRKIIGDSNFKAIQDNAAKLRRAQTVQLARTSLGAALTPHDEQVIKTLSPEAASAYVEGLKRGAASKAPAKGPTQYNAPSTPPVKDKGAVAPETLLRAGESLDGNGGRKVTVEELDTRAKLRGLTLGKVA